MAGAEFRVRTKKKIARINVTEQVERDDVEALGGQGPRERPHDPRDVEEVPVIQIVRNAVAAPGAAAHRQRERQRVVEASAGREAMRLVDDHAGDQEHPVDAGHAGPVASATSGAFLCRAISAATQFALLM